MAGVTSIGYKEPFAVEIIKGDTRIPIMYISKECAKQVYDAVMRLDTGIGVSMYKLVAPFECMDK